MIKLRGVSFGYPQESKVLADFDLTLTAGDRLALVGANGSGKTTILKIIMGLLTPQQGEVIIFGKERSDQQEFQEVRDRIGFLFQEPDNQLFCPTVADEVAFGPLNLGKTKAEVEEIVTDVLATVGLVDYRDRVPYQLSAGEKKRVALAAVLAMEPEVLLFDEPFAGLDKTARRQTISILEKMSQPYILVSHQQELVDRLVTKKCYLNSC
ncbi:energy-coupling factor ABC transporter ATP-binding protein [Halanaerobaculum tunisiense]